MNGKLLVELAEQTITFDPLEVKTYGDIPFDLTATSNSSLDLTYISSDTNIAKIEGNKVIIISAGTINIIANQAGDDNYLPAIDVSQILTVNKAEQIISYDPAQPGFINLW